MIAVCHNISMQQTGPLSGNKVQSIYLPYSKNTVNNRLKMSNSPVSRKFRVSLSFTDLLSPSDAESDPVCASSPSTSERCSPYKRRRRRTAFFLAPNSVPRNLDLPRLKPASDWLLARSACHICIKQLFDDGRGP